MAKKKKVSKATVKVAKKAGRVLKKKGPGIVHGLFDFFAAP